MKSQHRDWGFKKMCLVAELQAEGSAPKGHTFKSGDGRDLPKAMFSMGAEWLPHHITACSGVLQHQVLVPAVQEL